MAHIPKTKSSKPRVVVPSEINYETYYTAEPVASRPVRPERSVSALELMYAYYDAA